jgi:hypothetical protein
MIDDDEVFMTSFAVAFAEVKNGVPRVKLLF